MLIGDNMKKRLWDLFKETGNIKYYNLLGKMERSRNYGNRKNRRDRASGN